MLEARHTNVCETCSQCDVHSECIFSDLPEGVVDSRLRSCCRGFTIFHQGAAAAYVYFVRAGWVERSHVQPTGKGFNNVLASDEARIRILCPAQSPVHHPGT
jgi:hypothetical protein